MPFRRKWIHCIEFLFAISLLALILGGCKRNSSTPQNPQAQSATSEQFLSMMTAGRNYLDQGDYTNAIVAFKKAEAILPTDADVHLDLAISYLSAGQGEESVREAEEVLKLEQNSAAAYFVKGSAYIRLANFEEAVKAMENTRRVEPGVTATLFQLGIAHMGLKQWDAAIAAFREGLALEPNRLHTAVHYLLSQALIRSGKPEEGNQELQLHQANIEGGGANAATFERSKYTQARVPFKLDQPEKEGIKMKFIDATREAFGDAAQNYSGPVGVINAGPAGGNSLFVLEKSRGFHLLKNTNGTFTNEGTNLPAAEGVYFKMLVGDLQNDRAEDVIVLGDKGSQVFKFSTNGVPEDVSAVSRLGSASATDGTLIDLDFVGKLDLVVVSGNSLKIFRQFGPLLFSDVTSTSGIPAILQSARSVKMTDWNGDHVTDLIVGREERAPLLLEKQRGGLLVGKEMTNWVAGSVFTVADFDNDLRPDLAIFGNGKITICGNDGGRKEIAVTGGAKFTQLFAFDYDNDGWLDVWAIGEKIRVWRNMGLAGFQETTTELGLDKFEGAVSEIHFADFDGDCDSDIVVAMANGGLRYLRNDGGNGNAQIKVQLAGNRSNASGIGCKVEIETGGLRLIRTVDTLPVEIGVGQHQKLDSFLVHWFNWPQGAPDLAVDCKQPVLAAELTLQEGSCPYLYAWDGKKFRFVTDILGAAPLGLPIAEGRYIDAKPEELVWIGNEKTFAPKDGAYQIQITEELREVLYLDEARLVVVDHESGVEIHSTDKLLPGKPFPKGTLVAVHNEHALQKAETLDGRDVTAALRAVDGLRVSPPKMLTPQLRGLAERNGVILDFGILDTTMPLVLVMNGWLRFGGGMANIAASHDSSLPFPFPVLEAEVAGTWKPIDVTVGAPSGKTKTIIVDLNGKLPVGTTRLRLTEAFETHWDRIALMEKAEDVKSVSVPASVADIHFRGFSQLENLPADCPLTPSYEAVSANSYWTVIPGGWCTRYGDVRELVAARDEGLCILNSGDELTLSFAESELPKKAVSLIREFFLYVDGWDKDSDFHVAAGTEVGPLPFHGMDDQQYGKAARPAFASDVLHQKYNTRWVDGKALQQAARR